MKASGLQFLRYQHAMQIVNASSTPPIAFVRLIIVNILWNLEK